MEDKKRNNNLESLAADTILEKPITFCLGADTIEVSRPCTATLIEMSRYIAQLNIPPAKEGDDKLIYVLAYARDCNAIGMIAATLILGASNITATRKRMVKFGPFGIFHRTKIDKEDRRTELAHRLLTEMSTRDLSNLIERLINNQDIGFFFGLITSLNSANILHETKRETPNI